MERHSLSSKEAEDLILRTDKKRANYYNFYSNKKWSAADSYHLSVDSGAVGIERTVRADYRFRQYEGSGMNAVAAQGAGMMSRLLAV